MKIRNGFVSNSSSTSFLIGGFKIEASKISNEDIENKTYIVEGKEWCNATDIFYIKDINMLNFLKTAERITDINKRLKFSIYQLLTVVEGDEYEVKVDLSTLPKEGDMSIVSLEQDYGSSENVGDLFDRYLYEFDNVDLKEFDVIYSRFQRKDKLNKIEENV